MAQKIIDVLSKRDDRHRKMVLEEDLFAREIMAVSLSKGFKQSIIKAFDGLMDLLIHMQALLIL